MPSGLVKPVLTVVTGYGVVGCGVMIDTEAAKSAVVQRCVPSKAMPLVPLPRPLAATVTAPGGCVGSIRYRFPDPPATKTLPAATTTPRPLVAPVQVPSTLPVLACTAITWLSAKSDTQ